MKGSKLTPLADAARELGIGGLDPCLWLRRRCRKLEAEHGITLLENQGTDRKPRYRVSMVKLRKHDPALFDVDAEREEKADAAAVVVRKVSRQIATLDDRLDRIEQNLGAIAHGSGHRQKYASAK